MTFTKLQLMNILVPYFIYSVLQITVLLRTLCLFVSLLFVLSHVGQVGVE